MKTEIKIPVKKLGLNKTLELEPAAKEIAIKYLYKKLEFNILKDKIFTN